MPLKRRALVRKLGVYGVTEDKKRGKGGDRLLSGISRATGKKAVWCLGFHGRNSDVPDSIVKAIRRRFGLLPEDGVTDEEWRSA